jgi:hypothetical protein
MMCNMETYRSIIRLVFAGLAMNLSATALAETPALAGTVAPAATVSTSAPSPAPATAPSPAPSNQIWECTTNGLRTFSNNPCGTKSTVRQLNPINVMEPAAIYRPAPSYPQTMMASPAPVRYNYPEQDNGDEPATDNAYGGYPGVIVVQRARHVRPNIARTHPQPHPHHP